MINVLVTTCPDWAHDWKLASVNSTTGEQRWVCHRCRTYKSWWPEDGRAAAPTQQEGGK